MAKYYSLFGKTTTDTEIQVVKVNQIVIGFGYVMSKSRYVVYKVEHINNRGFMYYLINTDTKEMDRTDIINPLSKKFGIGRYYDDVPPEFMDAFEVAILLQKAQSKAKAEDDEAEKEQIRVSEVKQTFCREIPRNGTGSYCGTVEAGRKRHANRLLCKQHTAHRHFRFFHTKKGHLFGNAQTCLQFRRNYLPFGIQ